MLTAAEIGKAGEVHVSNWLANKGFSGVRNTQLPGATDIEAHGNGVSLLVQVKTAVSPNYAALLSSEETNAIVARANRLKWEAWSARVQINDKAQLVGEIVWTKLN